MSDHATYEEHAALYALGALDGADLVAYEIHRRECVPCRRAEADYARVATGIVPPGPAPETLKARVQAALPRRQSQLGTIATALAVAAVLILCLGMFMQAQNLRLELMEAAEKAADERAALQRDLVTARALQESQRIALQRELAAERTKLETVRKALEADLMASRSRAEELGKVVTIAQVGRLVRMKATGGDAAQGLVYYDPKGAGVVFFAQGLALKENEHLVLWMLKEDENKQLVAMNVAHCAPAASYGMKATTPGEMASTVQKFAVSIETDPDTKAPTMPRVVLMGDVKAE